MEVMKNISLMTETPARKMTKDAMQADYEYRMAQRCSSAEDHHD